jgi:uncharacterized protein with PQ loop repeat
MDFANIFFIRCKKMQARQIAAFFFCVCFFASLMFSTVFILTHINHKHDHAAADGGCAACADIGAAVKNILKQTSLPKPDNFSVFLSFIAIFISLNFVFVKLPSNTPVKLKTRLNN